MKENLKIFGFVLFIALIALGGWQFMYWATANLISDHGTRSYFSFCAGGFMSAATAIGIGTK